MRVVMILIAFAAILVHCASGTEEEEFSLERRREEEGSNQPPHFDNSVGGSPPEPIIRRSTVVGDLQNARDEIRKGLDFILKRRQCPDRLRKSKNLKCCIATLGGTHQG